jgi:hypothetical protein
LRKAHQLVERAGPQQSQSVGELAVIQDELLRRERPPYCAQEVRTVPGDVRLWQSPLTAPCPRRAGKSSVPEVSEVLRRQHSAAVSAVIVAIHDQTGVDQTPDQTGIAPDVFA